MSQSYENLKVWKDSIEMATFVYNMTRAFPREEQFGITSQMRRAAVSISSNIAEGSSRPSKKDYIRFPDIAIGSLNEVESLPLISEKLRFVPQKEIVGLRSTILALGKSLGGISKVFTQMTTLYLPFSIFHL